MPTVSTNIGQSIPRKWVKKKHLNGNNNEHFYLISVQIFPGLEGLLKKLRVLLQKSEITTLCKQFCGSANSQSTNCSALTLSYHM